MLKWTGVCVFIILLIWSTGVEAQSNFVTIDVDVINGTSVPVELMSFSIE